MPDQLQTALVEAVRAAMVVLPDELESREMAGDMPDYVAPVREALEKCEAALALLRDAKCWPTDTEQLDFLEKLAREHEAFMRAVMTSDPGPFAWADSYSGLTISIADGDHFHHSTARASIDAAMIRAGVLVPEQPKPATVPFSDTEPDEPVVQEVSPCR